MRVIFLILAIGAAASAVGDATACAVDNGEAAGATVPAGKTPAPESGAAEADGDG